MPNSHRPPDTTRRSCLCRVWCTDANRTIALNVFSLQFFFGYSLGLSGIQFTPPKRTRHRQVLSCLAWRCELALTKVQYWFISLVINAGWFLWIFCEPFSSANGFQSVNTVSLQDRHQWTRQQIWLFSWAGRLGVLFELYIRQCQEVSTVWKCRGLCSKCRCF